MRTQVAATVIDGSLELDEPVGLPDSTRVFVTVESVRETTPDRGRETGWNALKRRIQDRPVHAGDLHFTRDELHERR